MDIQTYSKHIKYLFIKILMHEIKADVKKSEILDLSEQSYKSLFYKELIFNNYSKVDIVNFYKCVVNALNIAYTKSRKLTKSKQNLIRIATPCEFDRKTFYSEDFINQLPYEYTLLQEDDISKYISVNYKICQHDIVSYRQDCFDSYSLNVYANNILICTKDLARLYGINSAELENVELCEIMKFYNDLSIYRGSFFISFLIRGFTQNLDFIKNYNLEKNMKIHEYKPSKNMGYAPKKFNCFRTTSKMLEIIR